MALNIILGKRLKELRKERGLTQTEVATALHLNSVTYLHYEKDQREPSLAVLAEMALFFGVTTDYLIGLADF